VEHEASVPGLTLVLISCVVMAMAVCCGIMLPPKLGSASLLLRVAPCAATLLIELAVGPHLIHHHGVAVLHIRVLNKYCAGTGTGFPCKVLSLSTKPEVPCLALCLDHGQFKVR
jgi:hypothetical protein